MVNVHIGERSHRGTGATCVVKDGSGGLATACGLANLKLLDSGRAPYGLYEVKYIDPVSLDADQPANLKF